MKIAIIADIHGNIFGLNKVLSNNRGIDKIICAGDLVGYYPFVNEVIETIKKNNILCIKGNHDKYLIDSINGVDNSRDYKYSLNLTKKIISKINLEFLNSLPDSLDIIIDNKRTLMFHGSPWNYFEQRIYPDFSHFDKFKEIDTDVIVLGHTHYPIIKKIGKLILINPGSCGQPRDFNQVSYVLWDTENNEFENIRLDWNIKEFIKKAKLYGIEENYFEVFKRENKV